MLLLLRVFVCFVNQGVQHSNGDYSTANIVLFRFYSLDDSDCKYFYTLAIIVYSITGKNKEKQNCHISYVSCIAEKESKGS